MIYYYWTGGREFWLFTLYHEDEMASFLESIGCEIAKLNKLVIVRQNKLVNVRHNKLISIRSARPDARFVWRPRSKN